MTNLRHLTSLVLLLVALAASACSATPTAPSTSAVPAAVAPTQVPTPAPPTATSLPSPTVPPPTPTPLPVTRIAVIGDFGLEGEGAAAVAQLVDSWQVDYVLTTGDNNYPDGAAETIDANIGQYYHAYIASYQGEYGEGAATNRFFPVLGNHDWVTLGAQPYLDYFTLPGNERYYTADLGSDVRLFAVSSHVDEPDGVKSTSVQAEWLQEVLTTSDACWNIVTLHHSPFSSGLHGSSTWMQWPYREWGADIVLGGHNHHYERLNRDGLTYVVNGVGGGALYDVGEPVEGSLVQVGLRYGAMLMEITQAQMNVQFVTVDGQVRDEFSIPGTRCN